MHISTIIISTSSFSPFEANSEYFFINITHSIILLNIVRLLQEDAMFEKLADSARDRLFLNSGIYIESNKVMTIENCERIEEYNDIFMQMLSGGLIIRVWGSGLRAYDYRTRGLVIRGRISQIEFAERKGRADREAETADKDKRTGE
jgi:hypothetical protein